MRITDTVVWSCRRGVYVTGKDPGGRTRYLHTDGEWRFSTEHCGSFTGYFESEEAAERALKKDSGAGTSLEEALIAALAKTG